MKKLISILLLTMMLCSTQAFSGNRSGYMTSDQKAALDGAASPSESNVLATMDDVSAVETGVQTITPGANMSNSGTEADPVLDVDVNDSSTSDTEPWSAAKIITELAGKQATGDYLEDGDFGSAGLMKTDGAGGYSIITDWSTYWSQMSDKVASDSPNWDAAYGWGNHADEDYFDTSINTLDNIPDGATYKLFTAAEKTRIGELESTDTPQFASVNIAGNYQFPQAIGSAGEALKVPAAGTILEWGSAGAISDIAYDATTWDNNSDGATKNALRDKFESLPGGHDPVTLNANATAAGLSLVSQEINYRAATNAQSGYMTAALVLNIEANNAKETNVSTALSEGTRDDTTYAINSDGSSPDLILPQANTNEAGLLSGTKFDEIVANSSKNTNVPTSLSVGTVGVDTVGITSDGGEDDVMLPAATVSTAGMFTTAKWGEVVANNAKNTNVSTDLAEGTATNTTVDVNSSDGNNATLVAASTSRAGVLTKAKFDEIVANTAKETNATHSGEVTGSGELTITAKAVTYAKMQDISATDKLLGRSTGGAGVTEEIPCTATGRAILASGALTRYLYWSPAYNGYALSADGGSNDTGDSGIIVAFAGTLGDSDNTDTPYIELSSTTAGVTDYDVIIRIPIPPDYSSMGTARIEYMSDTVLEDTATVYLYDSNDASDSSVALSSSTWAVDETMTPSGTYTAGEHMTIKLHLECAQDQKMRVGEIRIPYVSTR